jgi:kumamolisin
MVDHESLPDVSLRPLPGSERAPAPEVSAAASPLPADTRVQATLVLRRRGGADAASLDAAAVAGTLTPDELAAGYGAAPEDVALVTATLAGLGVEVLTVDAPSRRVQVAGSAALLGRVFGTTLDAVTSHGPGGAALPHRHRTGGLSVPADLDGVVTAVLGLDDRPQARAQYRPATTTPGAAQGGAPAAFTPLQLATVYRFPAGLDGTGQDVAIIELGGGFAQTELDTYFTALGITGPTVHAVRVDGATNTPGADPHGADGEVLLDIEVLGALAPGATLSVYFAPNTDAGFLDAISQATHATPTPTAMSISWGQSEDAWTAQARTAFDQAFTDAAALGISVTAAAGDDGSTDRATDGRNHVDFPASSPHVLACGGTRLTTNPATGAVTSETVWSNGTGHGATGGGVSDTFPRPAWQSVVSVPGTGRGVPDVAAVADPQTGYRVRVDGQNLVIGGTSAVAPLWAALIARLAQGTGHRLGLLHPTLYRRATPTTVPPWFRDITTGTNGAYTATPGWDPCTGLGVPDGTTLLTTLHTTPGPTV